MEETFRRQLLWHANSKILKPFKFCRDNGVVGGPQFPLTDPNCRKWDRGVTPVEQVRDFIDYFNSYMITASGALRQGFKLRGYTQLSINEKVFIPLKIIYDHYRFLLNREMFKNNPYLAGISSEAVDAIVANSKSEDLKYYHQASGGV